MAWYRRFFRSGNKGTADPAENNAQGGPGTGEDQTPAGESVTTGSAAGTEKTGSEENTGKTDFMQKTEYDASPVEGQETENKQKTEQSQEPNKSLEAGKIPEPDSNQEPDKSGEPGSSQEPGKSQEPGNSPEPDHRTEPDNTQKPDNNQNPVNMQEAKEKEKMETMNQTRGSEQTEQAVSREIAAQKDAGIQAGQTAREQTPAGEQTGQTERSERTDAGEGIRQAAHAAQADNSAQTEKAVKSEETEQVPAVEQAGLAPNLELDALEPADVMRYFREISAIPHGSFHTEQISDYLEGFAKDRGLDFVRDEAGNLIISRPASAGREKAAPIALQGHIDMVCEKEESNPIDMEKEAITLQTDGEWLWADRTTLGGDDGIAVAIMLALLADQSLVCPPLECIFTVDEEVGLLGAEVLDLSALKSRRLVNLDSEEEGFITAACAGGAEEVCTLPGRRREKKGQVLEISISGLRGGHSGERIGAGRANADLLLARLLYRLEQEGKYSIISMNGGTRDNAIPRDARAELIFTGKKIRRGAVKDTVSAFAEEVANEYSMTDPDIRIEARWTGKDNGTMERAEHHMAFTRKDSRRMVRFLMALPNGVIEYSPMDRNVPRTSLSLGIVRTTEEGIRTHSLVRSSVNSCKQMVMDRIDCIADQFGATVMTQGAYPAWELIQESAFRDLASEVYWRVTGKKAVVKIIHGGLECGLLAAKVHGLDCISIGPDMEEVHTPSERLNIPSCARTYTYIRELLAACAE